MRSLLHLPLVVLLAGLVTVACAPAASSTTNPPATLTQAQAPATAAPAPSAAAAAQPAQASLVPASAYTPTPLNPRLAVRVMDNQVSTMAPVYLAYDRGYFTQEGLDVTLDVLNDNATIIQTLATDQSQAAVTTPDPVIFNAIGRGIDIRIVAPSAVNAPADRPAQFVVRQDLMDNGTFKTPADLRGLNIAVPAQSSQWYVEKELSLGGLTLKDVTITVIATPNISAAFASKAIDAAWVPEPAATSLNAQHLGKTVAATGELYPGAVAAALLMAPQFMSEHPEAAQRLVIAYARGARAYYTDWMQGADRPSVVQSFVTHTTIKDPAVYDKIGLPSMDPNVSTDPTASWDVFQEFFVRQGLQEKKIDLSRYVNFSLVQGALKVLGRV